MNLFKYFFAPKAPVVISARQYDITTDPKYLQLVEEQSVLRLILHIAMAGRADLVTSISQKTMESLQGDGFIVYRQDRVVDKVMFDARIEWGDSIEGTGRAMRTITNNSYQIKVR